MTIESCDVYLSQDIQGVNCENEMYGGYKTTAYIWNKEDMVTPLTKDGTNKFSVTALAMKATKSAYKVFIHSSTPFPTTTTLVKKELGKNKYNKTVNMVLADNSPEFVQKVVDPLLSGSRFVMALIHERDGEGFVELFGVEKGLEAQDGATREEYSTDTDGGWNITLEEMNVPSASLFFYDTSATATLAALEALLSPAS